MVKPLSFKGEKKPKKRKRQDADKDDADGSQALSKNSAPAADASVDDDSWVSAEAASDVTGPIVIVLPTSPPSCVACDANGKVFPLDLENMVENDPSTAEPHDVRQVWVATKIAGSEHTNFKGYQGKYLSCDKFGILSAAREAVSNEENFLCIPSGDSPGMFNLQTERDTFLTATEDKKGADVRGDAESISFNTTLRLRMQARFKPKLQANKEERAREKISRKELEEAVGRRLEDDEVKRLKRARREGNYHEAILDARVKNKHDKYS